MTTPQNPTSNMTTGTTGTLDMKQPEAAKPTAPRTAGVTQSPAQVPSTAAAPTPRKLTDGEIRPKISVIGVGGAGGNAVNNMIRSQLEGVEFIVMNTDAQALTQSLTDKRVRLGDEVTQGLGAGSAPEIGKASAEEALEEIVHLIKDSNMVFIAAGMGGGTGTGAAPVIARAARELGILTVGVVTKPFHFEGAHRMRSAEKGISELQNHVDTLIVIPNQNLFRIANENTTFADAFKLADDVLYAGVRGVTDLMIMPGLINLDFADIRTTMSEMGKAMMGTGEADGESRAIQAAEAAISNPLLDDVSMRGATGVLISITGGMDMTLFEVDEAANRIREEVESDANIIFGSTFDDRLNGRIRVSVVATGIESEKGVRPQPQQHTEPEKAEAPAPQTFAPVADAAPLGAAAPDKQSSFIPQEAEVAAPTQSGSSDSIFEDISDEETPASDQDEALSLDPFEDATDSSEEHDETNADAAEENQMEIQFDTAERPQATTAKPAKTGFFAKFFGKKAAAPAVEGTPSRVSYAKDSIKSNNDDEDDLDVPTFMRRK